MRRIPGVLSLKRLPSLDGLRAVSIALVIYGHTTGTRGFPITKERFGIAEVGVRVFFIISGFLITTLLLQEINATGTVSLRGFYRRRVLRIFPAFYTYWFITLALVMAGLLVIPYREMAYAATYTINYVADRPWNLGHIWSLAVEEQFYALWPLALFLLGRKRAFWLAGGVLLLVPPVRVAQFFLWPTHRSGITEEFQTIADCIAAGCLLAGCRDWLWGRASYRRFITSWKFWLAPCAIVITSFMGAHPLLNWLIAIPVFNIAIALCIDRWTRVPHTDPVALFLNWKPVAFVGVLSYSLYLWQQPFLDRYSYHTWNRFPINIVLAFVFALGSYYAIERPFLNLRYRGNQSVPAGRSASAVPEESS
jgi:peptidoglycan/LPS O-acetylase OafA/YrhL